MSRTLVKCRVQVTVDIEVGNWGSSANFEQLAEQVKREGVDKLKSLLKDHGGAVVGQPKAIMAVVEVE